VTDDILRGPYVDLHDLLALRHRPISESRVQGSVLSPRGGTRLSRQRGRGIDFSEVRPYYPGDDIRTIDWRVTARKARPHTKVFREERERLTLLFVDQTQSMFFGSQVRLKSVAAAEFAALAAWRAIHQNDRIGGLVIGNDALATHKPYRNVKPLARFFGDLVRYNRTLARGTPLPTREHMEQALLRLRRLARRDHRIYLISDFTPIGDHWRDAFRALARNNEVIAVRVFDPLERELPPADLYSITDGTERWQFDAGNAELRDRYRARFAAHEADFAELCAQTGVRSGALPTDTPIRTAVGWL
jgi:uncharacterized protein (DUF58 family)